jgi:hypothetical protein
MAKKLGHGCLTADHEVLTPEGWTSIAAKPGQILTWNASGTSQFEVVERWTDYHYDGEMHHFSGNSIDALMTPEHRVPCVADTRRSIVRAKPASAGPGHAMPLGSGWIGGSETVPARLIAAFMSDGHQKHGGRPVMEFHFHKDRKKSRLIELCLQYNYKYSERGDKILVPGTLPKRPGAFMFEWTKECLMDFLDEYKHWDGHQSTAREDLEWIQTFGRICGIGARQWASGKHVAHTVVPTSERVYCPTVSTTWFYVRRNGKIFVTGNSNYYGKPPQMAKHAKIPTEAAEEFQRNYFGAFPCIPKYHRWVAEQLQRTSVIRDIFGRERTFFARANDDATLRAAIAHAPQSATAKRINLAIWRLWYHMGTRINLSMQVHDAVYFQYPETADEAPIIREALGHIDVSFRHGDRTMSIPGEAKVGWNWGDYNEDPKRGRVNLFGLKKFKVRDDRTSPTFLDRIF